MKIDLKDQFVYLQQNVSTFYTGISSILGQVKEYVLNQFPRDYFKKVTVETAAAASLMSQNMQDGIMKTSYPYMNIGLTVPSTYENNTTRTLLERSELNILPNIRQNYPRVLVDPDDNFTIGYTYEWVPTTFEFRMTTDSYMSSLNLMNWVRTKFPLELPGIIGSSPLEFELPQSIVKTIAELQGYDLNTNEGIRSMDRYLMTVSRMMSLIKRKTSATTGQQSYFMTINSDITVEVTGLEAPSSIIRNAHSEGEYVVSFIVNTGAYFPVTYLMKIRRDYLISRVEMTDFKNIYSTPNQPLVDGMISITMDVDMVDARTDIRNYTYLVPETDDFGQPLLDDNGNIIYEEREATGHLASQWTFVYGSEQREAPIVKIFDLIDDPEIKRVHSFAVEHNIDLQSIFYFEGYKVAYSQDDINFIMDYENFEINIENAEFSEVLIRFYLNRAAFETLKTAMDKDSYFFNKNVISFLDVLLWDEVSNQNVKRRVLVKYFKDEKEMYDENPLKAVKIYTKYGFGYLDIKPYVEDPNRTDDIFLINLGWERDLVDGKKVPKLYEIIFSE